jgi:GNAT superfamily N-acetyltransferase
MNYQIKKLSIKNYSKFWAVFKHSLLTDFDHVPIKERKEVIKRRWPKSKLEKEKIKIFYTSKNKKIIAYLLSSVESGGVSLMRWIWVKPDYRKQGIASQLIESWEEWAKQKQCHKLRFIAVEKNQPFYLKQGFKIEGRMKKDKYKNDYYIFGKILE